MTDYSLTALQSRRAAAFDSGDLAAYYAFDCLIGAVIGNSAGYERHNVAIMESRAHSAARMRAEAAAQQIMDDYAAEYARKNTRFDRESALSDH